MEPEYWVHFNLELWNILIDFYLLIACMGDRGVFFNFLLYQSVRFPWYWFNCAANRKLIDDPNWLKTLFHKTINMYKNEDKSILNTSYQFIYCNMHLGCTEKMLPSKHLRTNEFFCRYILFRYVEFISFFPFI